MQYINCSFTGVLSSVNAMGDNLILNFVAKFALIHHFTSEMMKVQGEVFSIMESPGSC